MKNENFLEWLNRQERFWAKKADENFDHDFPLGIWTGFYQVKEFLKGNIYPGESNKEGEDGQTN